MRQLAAESQRYVSLYRGTDFLSPLPIVYRPDRHSWAQILVHICLIIFFEDLSKKSILVLILCCILRLLHATTWACLGVLPASFFVCLRAPDCPVSPKYRDSIATIGQYNDSDLSLFRVTHCTLEL